MTSVIHAPCSTKDLHQGRFTGAVASAREANAFVIFNAAGIIQQRRIAEGKARRRILTEHYLFLFRLRISQQLWI